MSHEHLKQLADGLEIPNIEYWLKKDPSALFFLGKSIADQAKLARDIVQDARQTIEDNK